jgi:hypothetical protein
MDLSCSSSIATTARHVILERLFPEEEEQDDNCHDDGSDGFDQENASMAGSKSQRSTESNDDGMCAICLEPLGEFVTITCLSIQDTATWIDVLLLTHTHTHWSMARKRKMTQRSSPTPFAPSAAMSFTANVS